MSVRGQFPIPGKVVKIDKEIAWNGTFKVCGCREKREKEEHGQASDRSASNTLKKFAYAGEVIVIKSFSGQLSM
jgi:hypothetical protein